jgi:hypothetical protein
MPTAKPPDKPTKSPAEAIVQVETLLPEKNLPVTWTPSPSEQPPTPTLTPEPVSYNDLESVLVQFDYQTGVTGTIKSTLPEYGITDYLYESSNVAIFQEIDEPYGVIAVSYVYTDTVNEKMYHEITDWMVDISLDDYGEYVYTKTHDVNIGHDGYAVEFTIPYKIEFQESGILVGEWNDPEGETVWIPVPPGDVQQESQISISNVTFLVTERCNSVTFFYLEAPLSKVRVYAQQLDSKLLPVACK